MNKTCMEVLYISILIERECSLPNVEDGAVILSGSSVGDLAEYKCVQGFNLVGVKLRQCLTSGQWSGVDPRCYSKEINTCNTIIDN